MANRGLTAARRLDCEGKILTGECDRSDRPCRRKVAQQGCENRCRGGKATHVCLHAVLVFLLLAAVSVPTALAAGVARTIEIVPDGALTRIRIGLDRAVLATVTTLAVPARVVIESPELRFALPSPGAAGRLRKSPGLVRGWRRDPGAGGGRLVLDVAEPARILKAEVQVREGETGAVLVVELAPEASTGVLRQGQYEAAAPATVGSPKPIIVLDPGHGGVDPGTVGAGGVLEKDVVLSVAHRLRLLLLAGGRYQVAMTRAGDNFISLDARVDLAETIGADLFVSLHADAVEDRSLAGAIRGASVYVLSARASDEEARRLAERENDADRRVGHTITRARVTADVRGILADLMRREREEFSIRARAAVVDELGRRIRLNTKPARAAAFRVLRQPRTPAVLVELGYMSNRSDQQLMTRADWQQKVATALAASIGRYFDERARRRRF